MTVSLPTSVKALEYQRKWFADVRSRVAAGEPLALVNADAPQEILRAMDVPYVVNQWWASLVGAKRRAGEALDILRGRGLPDNSRQYDAVGLGSVEFAPATAPWGGLPRPSIVIGENSGDAGRKVFDYWSHHPGTESFIFERTIAANPPQNWWKLVPHDWERAFGSDRIDLMVAENWELVERIERLTGRKFSVDRLSEVMERVNRQAEWNRRSRDLLAQSRPTPISLHDSINSVMIPQWHRGTEWAVQAAEAFYREVQEGVRQGKGKPREGLRLMWIGRGLWFDMGIYERFEKSYGATFVWSMYLAIAADGYLRYGPDPMRALAARFVGITDQLYMPGWAADWYAKEAKTHDIDAVVHLVADDVPGAYFITSTLEDSGIPVLEVRANNADPRRCRQLTQEIEAFIASLVP